MLTRLWQTTVSAVIAVTSTSLQFVQDIYPLQPLMMMHTEEQINVVIKESTAASGQQDVSRDRLFLLSALQQQLMFDPANFETTTTTRPEPIVQGLIYFANPSKSIPITLPTDTIIIQVSDMENPNEILAAAKIPLYRVRLPLNFEMFRPNILPNMIETWNRDVENAANVDLLVQAWLCPADDAILVPCSAQESKLHARGIAKVIPRNIPGLPDGIHVRTAASLPLE